MDRPLPYCVPVPPLVVEVRLLLQDHRPPVARSGVEQGRRPEVEALLGRGEVLPVVVGTPAVPASRGRGLPQTSPPSPGSGASPRRLPTTLGQAHQSRVGSSDSKSPRPAEVSAPRAVSSTSPREGPGGTVRSGSRTRARDRPPVGGDGFTRQSRDRTGSRVTPGPKSFVDHTGDTLERGGRPPWRGEGARPPWRGEGVRASKMGPKVDWTRRRPL